MSGYSSNQLFGVTDPDGTYNHNPNRMIPVMKAMEILEDARYLGIRAVQFTGGGEPTVHKNCGELMLKAQLLGMETALVTNGQLLKGVVEDALMDSAWTRISIDAGTPETYQKTRGLPTSRPWATTLENVRRLVQRRDAEGSGLFIGIGFVVNRDNWREIPLAVGIAEDLGVDSIRFSAIFSNEGAAYYDGFGEQVDVLCREAEAHSNGRLTVSNNFVDRRSDLEQGAPDYKFCSYQHMTTYIGADLNVYRCCVISYSERGKLGSLKDQRLKDFWLSEEKKARMEPFNARGCDRCMFNERNRTINRLVKELPEGHFNFV